MGKHTAKTGTGPNRSRLAVNSHEHGHRVDFPKGQRRPKARLLARQKFFNEVLSKSPRSSRYKRPGSLKARTN